MPLFRALSLVILLGTPALSDEPLVVKIVTAATTTDIRTDSLTGEVVARDLLTASFPMSGRIASVEVDEGDRVARGTPLARMESVQQEQSLRAAEAGLSTAEADLRQAAEDFERQEVLLERGATTRINRDAAEDALRVAEGGVAQARAELDRAQKAMSDTLLLAPSDATVTNRMIEDGQVVGAAQPVLELALGSGLDAIFDVPEALLTNDTGQTPGIKLTLIKDPAVTFVGQVREVSPLIDAHSGTVAVTVQINTPPPGITYGDAVRGTASRPDTPHIMLPYTAMTANADGPAVWIVDPETMQVSLQNVTVERFETGRIILAGGIKDGTLVVTSGAQLLYPGRVVRPSEVSK